MFRIFLYMDSDIDKCDNNWFSTINIHNDDHFTNCFFATYYLLVDFEWWIIGSAGGKIASLYTIDSKF